MIYNDNVFREYGSFKKTSVSQGTIPNAYKPIPTSSNYASGYISRSFLLKWNDTMFFREIDPTMSSLVDRNLFEIVNVEWKIIGTKDKTIINGIIEDIGVHDYNSEQINRLRVKSKGVRLNPMEFWRGY